MTHRQMVLKELKSGTVYRSIHMTDDERVSLYEMPNEVVLEYNESMSKEEFRLKSIEFVTEHRVFLGNGPMI